MMRLGAMHLIMAFLASIGKIVGDGGLQNILTSLYVYAAATVNQMLQGKQWLRGRASDSRLREPGFEFWLRR